MKQIFVFFFLFISVATFSQEIRMATYNLRYLNQRDTGNLWSERGPVAINLIRFHGFDIFGTQEAVKAQLDDISVALPEYSRYGIGRDDGKDKGEHAVIYFRKDRFEKLKQGDFWLSETPEKPSLGWDAVCCNRICSWVYLKDKKTGKKFYVFNAHFDHQGVKARVESSKLMLEKMKAIAGSDPLIFCGDLNGSQKSEWYLTLLNSGILRDTYNLVKYPYASNASFNGFGSTKNNMDIIDHIFVSKHFTAEKWGILTDTYHGKYPSDHFPVMAVVRIM